MSSAAASGLALVQSEFGSSVNPITARGADYAASLKAKEEKINHIKKKLSDMWHGDDEESGDFGALIEKVISEKVDQMTQNMVEKMRQTVMEKVQKKIQEIVAKQAAKLAAKAGAKTLLRSAWGVGTLYHGASALYCAAQLDLEGAAKEALISTASTLPGVGAAIELADTSMEIANTIHDAYQEITKKIQEVQDLFEALKQLCEAAEDTIEEHTFAEIHNHPDDPEDSCCSVTKWCSWFLDCCCCISTSLCACAVCAYKMEFLDEEEEKK